MDVLLLLGYPNKMSIILDRREVCFQLELYMRECIAQILASNCSYYSRDIVMESFRCTIVRIEQILP